MHCEIEWCVYCVNDGKLLWSLSWAVSRELECGRWTACPLRLHWIASLLSCAPCCAVWCGMVEWALTLPTACVSQTSRLGEFLCLMTVCDPLILNYVVQFNSLKCFLFLISSLSCALILENMIGESNMTDVWIHFYLSSTDEEEWGWCPQLIFM